MSEAASRAPGKTVGRVAVVNLTSGGFSGGYLKYLRELVPLLRLDPRVSDLTVLGPSLDASFDWTWPADDGRHRWRALRAHLAAWRPDVIFIPTARIFPWSACPVVTMVRNMEPLAIPFSAPTWSERVRNIGRHVAAWHSARRANRVIAVSGFVRDYLVRWWHIPAHRIGVVPHGIDVPEQSHARQPAGLKAGGLSIFAAGSIRPARGLEDLVGALASLAAAGRPATLWFAGTPTAGAERYFARLKGEIHDAGIAERVHWLGSLGSAEMQWCFANASAFVMTSRVEACPNTVLEAMASAARSISTGLPPMPEFFGDTASYYPAGNSSELASGLWRVFTQEPAPLREEMCARARLRARNYSWHTTAGATVDQLAQARDEFRAVGQSDRR